MVAFAMSGRKRDLFPSPVTEVHWGILVAPLAQRLASVRPSATKAMTARARALRAEGQDVIVLSQGEPDFDTPPDVCDAGIAAIREGHTRYTAVSGIEELRKAVAAKLRRENGLDYDPSAIVVGCGAKQVIFNALFATLDPGDEVVVPAPCWVSYPDMVRLAGGTPVVVNCSAGSGFKLQPDELAAAITPRSKWLMLNSPANPTGAVYSEKDLAALGEVLKAHPHVSLLSDDIYEKLVYAPARFATMAAVVPELRDRTLLVNGVSKAHAMTGWRVGYGAGPQGLIKAMATIQGQTSSHTSSVSQYAALEAIGGDQSHLPPFVETFRQRRDLVCERLKRAPGLHCRLPEGAFYAFVSCRDLIGTQRSDGSVIRSDTDFAMYLLERFGVAVVPGSSFLAEGYFRASFANSTNALEKACNRIQAACEALVREVA